MSLVLSVMKGIVDEYLESALADEMPLYYDLAPQTSDGNYCIYRVADCTPDYSMSDVAELVTVEFEIWTDARSPQSALDATSALWAAFDDNTLSMESGSCVRADRDNFRLMRDPDSNGWLAQTIYKYVVQGE